MRLWALAVLSGFLQMLPFPIAGPIPLWRTAIAWFALAPLLKALLLPDRDGKPLSILHGAALGYCSGVIWYLGNCYWIYQTMHLYGAIPAPASAGILFLFCLYLGLYHALFGALVASFHRSRLTARLTLALVPFAWVAVELARARITGFPWDQLGVTQVDNLLLTRLAPYTGIYGISFLIGAVNALWLARITLNDRRHIRTYITAAGVLAILFYLVGLRLVQRPLRQGTEAIATLVQENLEVGAAAAASGPPLTRDQLLQSFTTLSIFPPAGTVCYGIPELAVTPCLPTQPAGLQGIQSIRQSNLIVWPEAPNDFIERDPNFRLAMSRLATASAAPVIAGAIGIDQGAQSRTYFNSAEFVTPNGNVAGRYDKMHLVPFGEYTPYKRLFFFAGSLLQNVGIFEPGAHRTVFRTGGHTYGTFICYESIFSDEIRQFTRLGADVLVNISDDGWYGNTSAAWEHLNMVRMRAIENHRWVIRATNTGVTSSIDPYGRVVVAAPRHIRTAIQVAFDYEHDLTFYAARGDVFAWLCVLVTALSLATGLASASSRNH
jgi:apolipoprotein N-acyltransferase